MNHAANAAILNFTAHLRNRPDRLDALGKLAARDEHRAEQDVLPIIKEIRQKSEAMAKVFPPIEDSLIAQQIVSELKEQEAKRLYAALGPKTLGPLDPGWRDPKGL